MYRILNLWLLKCYLLFYLLLLQIKWVVESANARIKRYKYLDRVMPNSQIPYIGDFVRIVCALTNKYMPPLSSPASVEQDQTVAARMLTQCGKVNALKEIIEEKKLPKRGKCWKSAEDMPLEDFSKMTEEHLREYTLGVYQLRFSPSYIQEHLDGNCDIHFFAEDPYLLCVKMQSRHVSSRAYCCGSSTRWQHQVMVLPLSCRPQSC